MSTGPGRPDFLVSEARELLANAEVVFGYETYIDHIRPVLNDQEIVATGMMQEMDRCSRAIHRALEGDAVALVSGGDSGVYGMAGLVLELCGTMGLNLTTDGSGKPPDLRLHIVPGVPALTAGAALVGAPLMTDFASISLSDLLTPWETIRRRIEAAAEADFVMVIYNPKSKKRNWQLDEVRALVMKHRESRTPVGIVRRAMQEGEQVIITDLGHMTDHEVDMRTIVFIGNSTTYTYGPFLITPRGYLKKYAVGNHLEHSDPKSGADR